MKHREFFVAILFAAALHSATSFAQLKAFPQAEGFGALATGGRGGAVYHVTNLNNSGVGSFRDAVSQPNRTVVFDVSGVINISSQIAFSNNLTIAGQTAPGGIAVYGHGVSLSNRNNIIIRSMTFRASIGTSETIKTVNMTTTANAILDHVSIGWGRYDNFGITANAHDITLQNSLIHEAINNQRAGGFIDSSRSITLARNLFINNQTRNPKGKADLQFINNVIYNWRVAGYVGGHSSAPWFQDLINNYFIAGPSQQGDYLADFNANDRVYHLGNRVDDDKIDAGGDGLPEGRNIDTNKFNNIGATVMPTAYNNPTIPVDVMTSLEAFQWAVERAGNSLHRDSADQRQITHLRSLGTQGYIPADESQVGGMPTWTGGAAPPDTDADGMSNDFELRHGLNVSDPADRNLTTLSPVGYTNLEVYLNSLMAPLYPADLAGDFNHDNQVDGADLTAWAAGFGVEISATHVDGDADGDQDVDGADFLKWQQQLGTAAASSQAAAVVPEPVAILQFAVATVIVVCSDARHRRFGG
jgi:pectate lyase